MSSNLALEIHVDTSRPQHIDPAVAAAAAAAAGQDCGSNQSGSDSGLGYTNSISSDTSTRAGPAIRPQANNSLVIEQAGQTRNVFVNSNNNNNNNNNKRPDDDTNSSGKTSNSGASKYDQHNSPSSCSTSSPSVPSTYALPTITASARQTKAKAGDADQTGSHQVDQLNGEANKNAGSTKQLSQAGRQIAARHERLDASLLTDTRGRPDLSEPALNDQYQPRASIALKSLLKRRPEHKSAIPKHNRSVSFNQTVIIFCEEDDSSPVVDVEGEPHGTIFTPPTDYRDHKSQTSGIESAGSCKRQTSSSDEPGMNRDVYMANDHSAESNRPSTGVLNGTKLENDNNICNTSQEAEDESVSINNILRADASSLTDDQLIGLLEKESLLETFRLHHHSDLKDEDFPINSIHSYLCDDAMSDYDSESESSLYAERKDRDATSLISAQPRYKPDCSSIDRKAATPAHSSQLEKLQHSSHTISNTKTAETKSSKHECPTSANLKSTPARITVSMLDSASSKRQQLPSTKPNTSNLKPTQLTNKLSLQHKHQESNNIIQPPVPMLIKQSVAQPLALSKPSLTHSDGHHHVHVNVAQASCSPTCQLDNKNLRDVSGEYAYSRQHSLLTRPNRGVEPETESDLQGGFTQTATSPPRTQSNCHLCQLSKAQDESAINLASNIKNSRSLQDDKLMNMSRALIPKPVNTAMSLAGTTTIINNNNNNDINNNIINNTIGVYSQSCVSCCEAMKQETNIDQQPHQDIAPSAKIVSPLTYQLVNVIDQNGNQVRALSLVRPMTAANLQNARLVLDPNGMRAAQPGSISTTIGSVPAAAQQPILVQRLPVANVNGQQYRIIGHAQFQALTNQALQQQQQSSTLNKQTVLDARYFQAQQHHHHAAQQTQPNFRRPTVYYVRQPLNAVDTVRHSLEARESSGIRTFPNPHEIRRLDGLRAPTSTIGMGARSTDLVMESHPGSVCAKLLEQNQLHNGGLTSRLHHSNKEDPYDPSFGFSNRPSVKGVATTDSSYTLRRQASNLDDCNIPKKADANNLIKQQTTKESHFPAYSMNI